MIHILKHIREVSLPIFLFASTVVRMCIQLGSLKVLILYTSKIDPNLSRTRVFTVFTNKKNKFSQHEIQNIYKLFTCARFLCLKCEHLGNIQYMSLKAQLVQCMLPTLKIRDSNLTRCT